MNKGYNYLKDVGQSKLEVTGRMPIVCHNGAAVPKKQLSTGTNLISGVAPYKWMKGVCVI